VRQEAGLLNAVWLISARTDALQVIAWGTALRTATLRAAADTNDVTHPTLFTAPSSRRETNAAAGAR